MKTLVRHWNCFFFAPGSPVTLGICRALFFASLFFWQVRHDFSAWGQYSSVFWMPIWVFDAFRVPLASTATLEWIQAFWKLSLLLSAIGLFSRVSMVAAFVLGTYLMGLPHNFGQTQHFDTLVVFVSGALAVSRAADAFSVDTWLRRRRPDSDRAWEYT